MSNDPNVEDPPEETYECELRAWEVKALAVAHMRNLADWMHDHQGFIPYVRERFDRIEQLLSVYEDMTRPPPPLNTEGEEVPF